MFPAWFGIFGVSWVCPAGREGNLESLLGAVDGSRGDFLLLLCRNFSRITSPKSSQGSRKRELQHTKDELSPGMGNVKNSLAGVSAGAAEGRESSLGIPEQERIRSCVFSSWISDRKGNLGMRNGSG